MRGVWFIGIREFFILCMVESVLEYCYKLDFNIGLLDCRSFNVIMFL